MSNDTEWAGLRRQPRVPVMVPGLQYPKPVVAAAKKCDAAYSDWAEAETAWMAAQDDLAEAKALDGRLFAESVLNGTDDPGEVHRPKAERALKASEILLDARLRDVNRAGRVLSEVMEEHAREIVLASLDMAAAGLEKQQKLMSEASELAVEALRERNRSLVGLREVSTLTRGTYQFDPSFPVAGVVQLPDISERRVRKIIEDLRALIDGGVLFPVDGVSEVSEVTESVE